MPPAPTRAHAALARRVTFALIAFCVGSQALSACRIGYEELPLLGAGARSTTATSGGAEVGGSAQAQGGDPQTELGGEPGVIAGVGPGGTGAGGANAGSNTAGTTVGTG